MDIKRKTQHLANIDLFQSFSESELKQFAEDVKEVTFAAGEQIFREYDPGTDMYILLEGSIKICKNNRFITLIEPVDYVGEMSILENKPRSATAIALTPVSLLLITTAQFKKYLTNQPSSLVSMMKTLSRRIRKDTELISEEFQKANILIHDMRNRLSAFILLNLIKDDTPADQIKNYLKIMQNSCADLSTMMDEALANAKRLKFIQAPETMSLNELVDDLLQAEFTLHEALKEKNIRTDIPSDLPCFSFPKNDIRRVLTNLVINAGQASKPGAEILIQAQYNNGEITVSVADEGGGIPANLHGKIFAPHFTTKKEGSGLGLASCKDIIEIKHKGRLNFQSSKKGTTFTFSIAVPKSDHFSL